jgi:hypothetical protein
MRSRFWQDSQAFTLMELSVALLVFLIGILGVLQLLVYGLSINQTNRDITVATALAQAKADDLIRTQFDANGTAANLIQGGILPVPNTNPLAAPNATPLSCYTEFFDYQGKLLGNLVAYPCANSTAVVNAPPANAYFVRQWQVWSCDASCGAGLCYPPPPYPAPNCNPVQGTSQDILRRITVTVTALSVAFRGKYPASTVVTYKTRID